MEKINVTLQLTPKRIDTIVVNTQPRIIATIQRTVVGSKGKSAYQIAVENGFEGTEAEWISSIPGSDGITPRIGENGNWFIGDIDTRVPATNIKIDEIYKTSNYTQSITMKNNVSYTFVRDTNNIITNIIKEVH